MSVPWKGGHVPWDVLQTVPGLLPTDADGFTLFPHRREEWDKLSNADQLRALRTARDGAMRIISDLTIITNALKP